MAGPGDAFERRREEVIGRLEAAVEQDPRIAAFWLQGSLADSTADPLSDVDAYLAIEDDAFDEVYSERTAFVQQLGSVLFVTDTTLPGLRGLCCLLDGPVKLDLFYEALSAAPAVERPAVRVLIDKAALGARLRTGWQPSREAAARRADMLFRLVMQGAAWPVRLLRRGQWATFAMVELELINDNLALLMAARVDPALAFKNRLSFPRRLPEKQRAELESLTAAMIGALAARSPAALLAAHLRVHGAIIREGRALYDAIGQPYPGTAAGDAAVRAFYQREWPEALPDDGLAT